MSSKATRHSCPNSGLQSDIFDVFESEDAVERFRAALGTIPEQVAHTVYLA